MNFLAKNRPTLLAAFTLVALTIGTALMTPSTVSAQFRRGGVFGVRPYGGGYGNVYNRGYGGIGYGNVYNRGYGGIGYGNVYNRGYGGYGYGGLGYGNGLLNQGIYSNTIVSPYASPIGVNNFGYGRGYGGLGGFGGGGFGGYGGFN